MSEILAVFVGGGLGSVARFGISKWIGVHENGFPMGTLTANFLSCIVLGLAIAFFTQKADIASELRLMILIGFCGGFSTFSTFSLETLGLIQSGQTGMAFIYATFSALMCIGVLWLISKLF